VCIDDFAPDLLAAVPHRKQNSVKVASALRDHSWIRDVSGAVTVLVLMQYLELRQRLQHRSVQPGMPDRFLWKWCSSGTYSSASFYRVLFLGQSTTLGAKELWHSMAPNKVRFFGWLAIHGRCWTADRRIRHGLQDDASCSLCSQEVETLDHLLLACVFSRDVWFQVLQRCGWELHVPMADDLFVHCWLMVFGIIWVGLINFSN
jgi:hypothetical protein